MPCENTGSFATDSHFPRALAAPKPVRQKPRPRSTDRLANALMALTDHHARIVEHREIPWASVTFCGQRHALRLQFTGTAAIAAGEALIAILPDHEFVIPGKIVADAAITEVCHRTLPDESLELSLELLLLDDA